MIIAPTNPIAAFAEDYETAGMIAPFIISAASGLAENMFTENDTAIVPIRKAKKSSSFLAP
jgi:hypothetical protein